MLFVCFFLWGEAIAVFYYFPCPKTIFDTVFNRWEKKKEVYIFLCQRMMCMKKTFCLYFSVRWHYSNFFPFLGPKTVFDTHFDRWGGGGCFFFAVIEWCVCRSILFVPSCKARLRPNVFCLTVWPKTVFDIHVNRWEGGGGGRERRPTLLGPVLMSIGGQSWWMEK